VRPLRQITGRLLATVPPVRRVLDELVRVEVVDRSMALAAQALLALIPLAVVLAPSSPPT
jgi:membrane protein